MRIVILGLSITSSWGNGHATTFRGLVRALAKRGHEVLFLERDMPWYAANRDLPCPPHGRTALYGSLTELGERFADPVREADLVVVGSYVPDGIAVCTWVIEVARGVRAFYDIDTPITVDALSRDACPYLSRELIPAFDLYLSFSGGPILNELMGRYGARRALPLYCAVDPDLYAPLAVEIRHDLGYLGTYSTDRQLALERLLIEPARAMPERRFVVAGPQYPAATAWPANVERIEHLAPDGHRAFYAAQRWALNITRALMLRAGYSPSVRLFEAATCGTPIISDPWPGLDQFFRVGEEILTAHDGEEVSRLLTRLDEGERAAIGARARTRVLSEHTAAHRAISLEAYVAEARGFR